MPRLVHRAFKSLAASSALAVGALLVLTPAALAAGSKQSRTTTPPTISITSPASGTSVSGTVSLAGSASGKTALASVQLSVDGGSWQTASGTTSWTWSWNTTSLANGTHSVEARVTDTSNNTGTTTRSVTVSNQAASTTPPTVSITAPGSGASVSGSVSVSGSAASSSSTVAGVAVSVDGGSWQAASGTNGWSWSWNTAGVANGTHTIAAQATDAQGHASTVASESVTVDNVSPPAVTISSPASGSTVSGSVAVGGTASSNGSTVARVAVSVDGGSWQTATGTTNWNWSWDTTSVANGTHTVAVQATDAAGNVSSVVTDSVTVSNSTVAPDTQGSWVSPEGVHIIVNTAGSWTISQVYSMLLANALDLSVIGPHYTIDVQDQYSSITSTSAVLENGSYTNYAATTYLQGVNSTFASYPDYVLTHEYGIAWSQYYLYMQHGDSWSSFTAMRQDGSTYNGTTYQYLGQDPRLDGTQTWEEREIIADDYRLLFGSSAAVSERPYPMNSTIVDPRNQSGLGNWLLNNWA